ncbi:MAG: serine/threonine-protein kinase [Gemmatimonadales bacterium]
MKTCPVCSSEWPDDTRFCPKDGSTLRAAAGADLIGSIVADRYHIEKKLGEGGMGAVYLGEHVKMGRKSAIKVMTQSMASDPEAIARFNREAANAARINHPNVCAIYDFGETEDGTIYLAMEFIEGETLSDMQHREGALELDRAVEILQQTGEALQAAHDLGIVHRDLKPDNIMIARARDGTDVVKVVDFGIAKAMTGEEGQKVTRTGLVVGTPEYMSPEQLSGDVLNGRSDIYSLALVFFRMVTGALPFQAESSQETMIKRLTDDPLKLSEVAPDAGWPPRLQGVMDRALERMPADRYESAALFARDALDAVRGAGRPIVGVDTEGATEVIGAGGVTEQLPSTRVSGGPDETTPQTPVPAPSAPAERTRKRPVAAIAVVAAVIVVGGGIGVTMMGRGGDDTEARGQPSEGGAPAVAMDSGRQAESETVQPAGAERQVRPVTARVETETQEPPLDTAALRAELDVLFFEDVEDVARRPAARQRAQRIYDDPRAPAVLRAQAAGVMGQAYWVEERMTDACRWFGLADQLDPDNGAYTTPLTRVCAS